MLDKFNNIRIILASDSPRRRMLLQQIGFRFDAVSSGIEEDEYDGRVSPEEYVKRIASSKASHVGSNISEGIIVGADTIVVIDGRVFGKPKSQRDAIQMLELLNGRWHYVYTGVSVIRQPGSRAAEDCAITGVKFRNVSKDEIAAYAATGEPLGKAGAYAIQERGAIFVEEVHGCFFNVVGLPIAMLLRLLDSVVSE